MQKIIYGLLCIVLLPGLECLAGEAQKLKLVLHWYAQADDGGYYTALAKGYYRDAGIDLEIVQGGPNPNIEMHVSTENATLGIVPADKVLLGAARGLPLVSVMVQNQHDPQAIMVHAASPIKTLADLSGRKISVTTGATFFVYLQNFYHYKDTTVVPYTGAISNFVLDPEYIQQAFPHAEPFYAAQKGVKSRCLLVSESGFDPYRVVVGSKKMLVMHSDLVRAFCKASYRGWIDFYRDPKPALAEIQRLNPLADAAGLDFAVAEMQRRRFLEGDTKKGEFFGKCDPKRWQLLAQQLEACGLLKTAEIADNAYTNAYMPLAVGVEDPLVAP
jgi:NitT/TauT family transport system substrate-binding protein